MFITRLCSRLTEARVTYALCGGWAVALHGVSRGTVDVDIVVNIESENLTRAVAVLSELGLLSRIPLSAEQVSADYKVLREERNLLAWNFYNPQNPIEQVDIVLTESVQPSDVVELNLGSSRLPCLSRERLIAMKQASGRPQDLADVDALTRIAHS